ncbi:MAG: hypothetical protein AAF703_16455 [Cyanobacteria bacterium P01_D01_bin.105]
MSDRNALEGTDESMAITSEDGNINASSLQLNLPVSIFQTATADLSP